MSILTGLVDTNYSIFYNLDFISILYLLETCKELNILLKKDIFWREYILIQLKYNKTSMSVMERYRPICESYFDSFKLYYSTEDMENCIKNGRCDTIEYIREVYDMLPSMRESQLACKYGQVKVLDFLRDEYELLPTCARSLYYTENKKPQNPRKLNPKNYPDVNPCHGVTAHLSAISDIDRKWRRVTIVPFEMEWFSPNDLYGLKVAIKNNHLDVVMWIYDNVLRDENFPKRINILQHNLYILQHNLYISENNPKIYEFFLYINTRDNLGLST